MRIWPVGSILVLETFSGKAASVDRVTPTAIDCIRKFKAEFADFPANTLFPGVWCYQRFSADGKVGTMPAEAVSCHGCHSTAFSLTGDRVFTIFSN
jgi:hypothetical protein